MGINLTGLRRQLFEYLIGLARACVAGNPRTDATDSILLKGLRAVFSDAEASVLADCLASAEAEKAAIVPGCMVCQSPCGNTSSYA